MSHSARADIVRLLGVPESKVHVIYEAAAARFIDKRQVDALCAYLKILNKKPKFRKQREIMLANKAIELGVPRDKVEWVVENLIQTKVLQRMGIEAKLSARIDWRSASPGPFPQSIRPAR